MKIRHNRREEFDSGLADATTARADAQHWSGLSAEPSDPRCIAHRAETLRAAWREPIDDRIEYLRERCRDRRVLDIGCVAHDAERSGSPSWLHAQLSAVASSCVGVDVLPGGVAALAAQGFDVVCHDFTEGVGPFDAAQPFDVVVVGELIEHLGSPDMVFRTAAALLADDGALILTTPNPYAPARVRAGLRGIAYENCDHVVYAFPAGIAELADRFGLRLVEARTTSPVRRSGPVRRLKRWIRSSGWRGVGIATLGPARVRAIRGWGPLTPLFGDRRFVGETFVYVVARPTAATSPSGPAMGDV